jgi:succinate-acetate transporter protein
MFFPVSDWFAAFLLTLAVEIPVASYLLRRAEPDLPRRLLLVLLANLLTHPAVWFIFTQLLLIGTPEYTLAVEAWAVGLEALFYAVTIRGLTARRAIAVALVANAASFAVGRLLDWIGWEVLA